MSQRKRWLRSVQRRRFIKTALAAGAMISPVGRALADAASPRARTPRDYEGPFYPKGPRHRSSDLILGTPRAPVLRLRGRLVDVRDRALPGARLEIWQTDLLGRYRHPADNSPGERWEDFLYWGEALTDADGAFSFRTYVPGAYGRRPAHIHYKVWSGAEELLTSQLYFAERGGAAGAARSPRLSHLQTVHLIETGDGDLEARFDVVI